jgi:hypothetical protein
MRVCEITDGVVVNIVDLPVGYSIAEDRASASCTTYSEIQGPEGIEQQVIDSRYDAPDGCILVFSEEAEPGWNWTAADGFTEFAPVEPAPVLAPITHRQLRLTLLAHELLQQVEIAIEAFQEPDRSAAMMEWQDSAQYRRDDPLITQIGAALELDAAALDAMWIEAMGC